MSATETSEPQPIPRLSTPEFIALMGMMFATIAFSIDAMLPALPEIATELTPDNMNYAQLVITSFVLGMGAGTLLTGPISDTFGRKPVILAFTALYILGAALAWAAGSMELLIAARIVQGFGAAGPRVVALALVRDLYSGREMARIVSFVMLVFTIFPAVAPLIGQGIITLFDWRAIFVAFLLFSLISVGWLTIRQPETLPPPMRRPMRVKSLWDGAKEALSLRQMQLSILVQTLIFGLLFGTISSIQPIFDLAYGRGEEFHWYFFVIALLAAPAAPLNGWLVVRVGMRPLVRTALWVQATLSTLMAIVLLSSMAGPAEFWIYFVWTVSVFCLMGFTIGNLNALALEPLGHIAGLAASIMGGLATIAGAAVGALVGQLFTGTATPLAISVAILTIIAAILMRFMPRDTAE
ncbi:MFS transporter [Rhodobacterales bacterium HKCCE4037]|nr:MFS transporter [Rhodobacterales bacterium HKCCE4037]